MATAESGRTRRVSGTVLTRGTLDVYHDPHAPCDSARRATLLWEADVEEIDKRPCSKCFDVPGRNEPSTTQTSGAFNECPHCGAGLDGQPLGNHMHKSCPKADLSQTSLDDLPALEDAPPGEEF